jgi:ABC-type molybdate transport system substrate-binding protein
MNEYEAGQPGACGQDGGETVATEEVAPAEASEEVSCEQFTALGSGEFSQYQAQQFYDFIATPEQQAILDPDGNGYTRSSQAK